MKLSRLDHSSFTKRIIFLEIEGCAMTFTVKPDKNLIFLKNSKNKKIVEMV